MAKTLFLALGMMFLGGMWGAAAAQASAIALDKTSFSARAESGFVSSDFLKVSNIANTPQQYRLAWRAGSAGDNQISITPASFVLGPAEEKNIVLRFRQGTRSGLGEIELVVYDLAKSGALALGSGVKIPVQFIVPEVLGAKAGPESSAAGGAVKTNSWLALIYLFDFLLALVVIWLYGNKSRRAKKLNNRYD